MRLWSLHPKYLDKLGLLGLWREGLLAQKVLLGKTKGYKNHPQLIRFKKANDPILYIGTYLYYVYLEGKRRGYNFNKDKIIKYDLKLKMPVTIGQINFEFRHLLEKLKIRDKEKYEEIKDEKIIKPNPIFYIIDGDIEEWEKDKKVLNKK
ncbi:MAG: pyrimidine dimer DNA glycosylase/endonuclease V [Candidatus Nanopusillus acidilobi]